MKQFERVVFKLFNMPCCGHQLCWVNPRYPTFCPQCGEKVFGTIKGAVILRDDEAVIEIHVEN